ncbi:MAG: GH1 family beta-glucosidase [Phycisphaerales bacterium]
MMFPRDFVWGAASSAYQVEGAASVGGRGSSVWDEFCKRPGAVHNNQTGSVACDHYHRFAADIGLMRTIGLQAYRFSVSWPRVLPTGTGTPNQAGLDFYDRLVDGLLAAGIEPWITLYHWDMPQALYLRGGWLNRDSAEWFAQFADLVGRRLSDRVHNWMTINEPQVYIGLGHAEGKHAPGVKLSFRECLQASHHTLLAHGRGVQTLRAAGGPNLRVGWAPIGHIVCPASDSPEDVEAARAAMFTITRRDFWNNTWFGDPVCLGHYPEDGLALFGHDAPAASEADMRLIRQPLDFYGVNIYTGSCVRAGREGEPVDVPAPDGAPITTFRWLIRPESLYWGPRFIAERYRCPVVVTENGMSNLDFVDLDGRVQDPQRIDYTRRYLLELSRAIRDGVNVTGYFHWSIMDNFEWAEGYKERFGLIHVDYATQARTLKDSAHWYARVIASNGESLRPPNSVQRPTPVVRTPTTAGSTTPSFGDRL